MSRTKAPVDTLSNVTGRAWLVAELDRIWQETCPTLAKHYRAVRRGRTADRRAFVDAIDRLQDEAFLTARAIENGRCDIRAVLSVFNVLARLDHAVHGPDLKLGRSKAAKDDRTGFGSKRDEHERWAAAHAAAVCELEAAGRKRVNTEGARLVVERLGLTVTAAQVLRAVHGISGQK